MRRRAGIERELASRADQRVLRFFGHVARIDEYRMTKRVLMAEVSEGQAFYSLFPLRHYGYRIFHLFSW